MGLRVFLASALMLLTSIAFAEHAISLDTEAAPASPSPANAGPVAEPAAGPAQTAALPARPATANVKVAFPSELDVYLVETGTREICDTFNFGDGDVRTECRTVALPVRAEDPALRGICITRYGNRTCY